MDELLTPRQVDVLRRIQAWIVRRWPAWAHRRRLRIRTWHLSGGCGTGPCRCKERIAKLTPPDRRR